MKPDVSALEVRGLTKRFDRLAVDALDLTVRTRRILCAARPQRRRQDHDACAWWPACCGPMPVRYRCSASMRSSDPVAAKQITAWVSDEPMIYDKLTPLEYLEFVAGLWGIDPGGRRILRARAAGLARARAASARALRRIFQGHAPEGGAGRRAGARPAPDHPGRAAHRPRRACPRVTSRDCCGDRVRAGCTVIMTTHILEVAERMADRIGVIAVGPAGRRGHAGRTAPAERPQRHQPRRHVHRAGRRRGGRRMSSAAALTWFARHEIRLAWREWLAMMTARPAQAKARRDRAARLCRDHASAGLCGDRPLRRSAGAARQIRR